MGIDSSLLFLIIHNQDALWILFDRYVENITLPHLNFKPLIQLEENYTFIYLAVCLLFRLDNYDCLYLFYLFQHSIFSRLS